MSPVGRVALSSLVGLGLLAGCDPQQDLLDIDPDSLTKAEVGKADSSIEAVVLDFEFDGEMWTSQNFWLTHQIENQLLYTVGELNGTNSVGRLDRLELTDVHSVADGGLYHVTYHARLPVAWGRLDAVPSSYTLRLPRVAGTTGLTEFTDAYSHDCVDWSAHDVDVNSMWYYFRPDASGCTFADGDVTEAPATVSVSDINTTGKYPEYDKVWEDGTLRVTAVFGKNEADSESNSDAGISAFNRFSREVRSFLDDVGYTSTPADLPYNPGAENPDLVFEAQLADGRDIVVTALLVDNVRTAGPQFDQRYAALSRDSDIIVYSGHSGLGANIRALAQKGDWVTGQYAIVFMNGCDTYAYVDSALADAHTAVNADDPNGTRYLDLVMNGMPSYFHSNATNVMALVRGLASFDAPMTFEQIFEDIDSSQVVLVSGEQDNEYVPGGGGDPEEWDGLTRSGTVAQGEEQHFETPVLEAGTYEFVLDGTGDADLYVRVGEAPTVSEWTCRPYRWGSAETCVVDLPAPAAIFGMVRGWDSSSDYDLVAGPQ
jgi:hypothetical protein